MKFFITTLGCKVNQFESEAIAQTLQTKNNAPVQKNESADICIINTCTVTRKAAMQSRQAVRQAIKAHPDARIIVTGCYAQTEADAIKKIKGVHHIIGHADKLNIPDMVSAAVNHKSPSSPEITNRPVGRNSVFAMAPVSVSGHRTRPFLKIQDGCSAFCTYCIVPYARGRSRSMPFNDVLSNIQQLKQSGYREIVLSGIHAGCYGADLTPKSSLYDLLTAVSNKKLMDRVRLSSIEPIELSDDIIQLVSGSDSICNHFHIPLQSGDDAVLNKMNRPYTSALFKDLVLKINRLMPNAGIGADILIGFPGETDKAFQHTYDLIQSLPITYLHVFPFSPRKGTPAYTFSDQIDTDVIKNRCKKMRDLGKQKKSDFYKTHIGKTLDVLIEETRDRKSGLLKGLTANYIPVMANGDDRLKNSIIKVEITKLAGNSLIGSIT